ncbi:MAG: VWA domain-containing protein [Terriglobia bacterium]
MANIHSRKKQKGLLIFLLVGVLLFLPENRKWAVPTEQGVGGTLRVDVDMVTVEVVVQDKKGSPILGLGKENFKLFDDGKPQQIISFDAVADSGDNTVPTSLSDIDENKRGKVVFILFDDSNITPQQLKNSRDVAAGYVKKHMRPWDLFAVGTYGLSLQVTQTFTHDADKVYQAIQAPAMSHALQDTTQLQTPDNQDPTLMANTGQVDRTNKQTSVAQGAVNTERRYRASTYFRSMNSLSSSIARIKGRKIILLFSEDFKVPSELQTELQDFITVAQKSNVAFYTVDAKGLNLSTPGISPLGFLPRQGSETVSRSRNPLSSWSSFVRFLFPAIDLLRPNPSSFLFTPHYFQARGGGGGGQGGGQGGGGQSGGGASGGNAGGAPGQGQQGGTGNTGIGSSNSTNPYGATSLPSMTDLQQNYLENVLRTMAHSTGGTSIFNTNNLSQGLDKVDTELSNYYVLGFNPSSSKRDGKLRKIEVKTDVKGAKLKYRTGYVDPRPPDALAGSKEERSLLSAISSPSPMNQLPLTFRPMYFYDASGLVRVPISASIQHGAIELKKKGPLLVNSVDVMGVAYGEDGSIVARFSETMNLAIDKEKESAFKSQDIPYQNALKLRPGKYRLKMAIADDKGKIGTVEQPLVIPPLPAAGLASSSLIITQRMAQLPELIRSIQAKLMEENDPLSYKGMQLFPDVDQVVSKEGSIAVYYKLYNLKSSEPNRHLIAKIQVLDEKGVAATNETLNLDDAMQSTGNSEVAVGFSIPLKTLNPGKYQLKVVTEEAEQDQSVTTATEFIVQ